MTDAAAHTPNPPEAAIELGRLLLAQRWGFLKGVVSLDQLPAGDRPEIAFAGRSNVGKSSLINALTNQSALARTSNTPGRTRELNFFTLNEGPYAERLYLVDLPGYGYARIERERVKEWTRLLKAYLRGRATLARVFLLIDARHGIKANDEEIMAMLDETAVSYQIVLTKFDKLKKGAQAAMREKVAAALRKRPAAHPVIHATSSATGEGLAALKAEIAMLAGLLEDGL